MNITGSLNLRTYKVGNTDYYPIESVDGVFNRYMETSDWTQLSISNTIGNLERITFVASRNWTGVISFTY